MTPQTLNNDLDKSAINTSLIVLLIIDEAHKTSGDYAYSCILKKLSNQPLRIVALSATPGNNVEQFTEIFKNLGVSTIQMKDENDADIKKFTHHKHIEIIKIKQSANIKLLIDSFNKAILPIYNDMKRQQAIPPNVI